METLALPQLVCRLLHQLNAGAPLILRHFVNVQNVGDGRVVRLKYPEGDLRRPARFKYGLWWNCGNVCVDQGSTAHTGSSNYCHTFEATQICPAVVLLGVHVAPNPLVFQFSRVGGTVPFLAALQHQHLLALFGQTARSNSATEATANHDYVKIHLAPPLEWMEDKVLSIWRNEIRSFFFDCPTSST